MGDINFYIVVLEVRIEQKEKAGEKMADLMNWFKISTTSASETS